MGRSFALVRLAERAVALFRLTSPAELRSGSQDVATRVRQLGSSTAALCSMLPHTDQSEPRLVHAAWFCVMDLHRCLTQCTSLTPSSSAPQPASLTLDSVQHLLHVLRRCEAFCTPDEQSTLVELLSRRVARASLPQWRDKELLEALHTIARHTPRSPPTLAYSLLSSLEARVHTLGARQISILLWCMAALRLYDRRRDLWAMVCVRCHVLYTLMDGKSCATVLHALLLAVDQAGSAQEMLMRTVGQTIERAASQASQSTGRTGVPSAHAVTRAVGLIDVNTNMVDRRRQQQLQLLFSARILRPRALTFLLRRWYWYAWRLAQQRQEANCLSRLSTEGMNGGSTHGRSIDTDVLLTQQTEGMHDAQAIMRVLLDKSLDERDAVEVLHLLLPPPGSTTPYFVPDTMVAEEGARLHSQLAVHAFTALAALIPAELHKPHIVLRAMLGWLAHCTWCSAGPLTSDKRQPLTWWRASVSVAAECCRRHRQVRATAQCVTADAYDKARVGTLLWSLELADDVWRCAGVDAAMQNPTAADTADAIARDLDRRTAEASQAKRPVTSADDEGDADTLAVSADVLAIYAQIVQAACATSVPALQCSVRETSHGARLLRRSCRVLAAGAARRCVSRRTALQLLRAVCSAPMELTTLLSSLTAPLLRRLESPLYASPAGKLACAPSCNADARSALQLCEDAAAVLRDCDPCYSAAAVQEGGAAPSVCLDGRTRAGLTLMPDAVLELYLRLILQARDGGAEDDGMTALLSAFAARRGNVRGLETAFQLLLTRRMGQSSRFLQVVQLPHTAVLALLAYAQALRQLPRSTHICTAVESALFAQLITGLQQWTDWMVLNDIAALLSTRACLELHVRLSLANALCARARVLVRSTTSAGSALERAYLVAYLIRARVAVDEQLLADMRSYPPVANA